MKLKAENSVEKINKQRSGSLNRSIKKIDKPLGKLIKEKRKKTEIGNSIGNEIGDIIISPADIK